VAAAYRIDRDDTAKIADGHLLAFDDRRAIARTCDDRSGCGYVSVDRTTGTVTDVPIDTGTRYLPNFWAGTDATRIAPDGRTIAVAWSEPGSGGTLGVIDLVSGELTVVSEVNEGLVRWTPDARFVIYLEAGMPMAHEIESGESFVISDDLPRLNAIAVRAPSGS
jgi:hypothetical protein